VRIRDAAGADLDYAMAVYHPHPHSYTGEDLCEISCHGNPLVVSQIMEAIRATRLAASAGRGEFTRRAYLAGKLDLAQAEAVGALIEARSLTGLDMARSLLKGGLSGQIVPLCEGLINLLAQIESSFLNEDAACEGDQLLEELSPIMQQLEQMAGETSRAATLYQGIRTVIAGLPNAGKSSLLNAILGYPRAIVHEEAGTTRDIIREHLLIKGKDFIVHDTAGIKEHASGAERIGIERTLENLSRADLVLYVVDAVNGIKPHELQWLDPGRKTIVVLNKIDLIAEMPAVVPGYPNVHISARYSRGLDDLFEHMAGAYAGETPQVFLERHIGLLEQALDRLQHARRSIEEGLTPDVLAIDLQEALHYLGEITGKGVHKDILDQVFTRFCVGK